MTHSDFEIVMLCLDGALDGMLIFKVFVAALFVDHLDLRHVRRLAQCCKLATRRFHEPISLAARPSVKPRTLAVAKTVRDDEGGQEDGQEDDGQEEPLTLANFEPRCIFTARDNFEWHGMMNTRQAKIGMGEYNGGVIREDVTFTVEHTEEEVRGHRFVLLANTGAVAAQERECEEELAHYSAPDE